MTEIDEGLMVWTVGCLLVFAFLMGVFVFMVVYKGSIQHWCETRGHFNIYDHHYTCSPMEDKDELGK